MTSKTNFINYFLLAFTLAFISSGLSAGTLDFKDKKKDKEKKEELTADGPYVLYQPDGQIRVINVDKKGNIIDTTYTTLPQNFTLHVTDHKGRFPFDVKLHPVKRPGWNYPQADKVFVMSDPHGRLDCVISLLQGNHIIDKDYKWSFGKNHLMIIGDIFDRGKDVPQIFWLFYKLEEEAAKAGGHVSFILGNHEPMVLANDLRYTKEKYKILAEKLEEKSLLVPVDITNNASAGVAPSYGMSLKYSNFVVGLNFFSIFLSILMFFNKFIMKNNVIIATIAENTLYVFLLASLLAFASSAH